MTLSSLLLDAGAYHQGCIALVTPGGRLSYGELSVRALRLSAFLIDAGVRSGDRVVICLPKCAELSMAIFGVLLTGGCYVPIDYMTPAARALMIIQDSEAKAVICTYRLGKHLFDVTPHASEDSSDRKANSDVFVYILNQPAPSSAIQRSDCVAWPQVIDSTAMTSPVSVDPDMRAYILYTSGSTGRPKGVVHTHASAMTFVSWANGRTKLGSEDVMSQHASPSFDLTVFDFFCSTMAAATLTLVPEWMFGQLAKTCRFIVENGITVWYSVPSALLRSEGGDMSGLSRSSLRHVVFAGEVIPKKALKEFVEYLPPDCLVSNWYGPTETNVCTHHDITIADLESDIPIPIGMPCPYARVRIDTGGSGQPDKGELLVDSPTNMEGYWKLDRLTADAFTVEVDNRHYYKTGDIVAYNDDKLHFLGRKDRQLKVRGYRLQPEEIEQTLRGHADVVEAAVVVINEDGTELIAAAVVVMANMEKSGLAELKRFCNETLPLYMIPSKIIRVAALPRGARGKVDLQAISKLISSQEESETIEMT